MSEQEYYYNVRTGAVQTNVDKGQGKELMGPYPSADAARAALRAAADRTTAWDEDERWRDDDD